MKAKKLIDNKTQKQDDYSDDKHDLPAVLSLEKVNELDKHSMDNVRGLQRRLTLIVQAHSIAKHIEIYNQEPEVFEEMLNTIKNFMGHAQGLAEAAECSYNRLLLAALRAEDLKAKQSI